ncbi:unnamed protein product [Ilex paraguariensis]|uniref:Uncharacterized protein n=1 Tax=Ilex paraguariensis TaxID=185542 RepID=A0ABC8SS71_9AQUA
MKLCDIELEARQLKQALIDATAGAIAGAVSRIVTSPLDVIRFQGFWRGNVPALLMFMPYTAIQFTVLHQLKTFAAGSSKTGREGLRKDGRTKQSLKELFKTLVNPLQDSEPSSHHMKWEKWSNGIFAK